MPRNPSLGPAGLRIPLLVESSNRAGTPDKDAKLVNCYIDKISDKEFYVVKRRGRSKYAPSITNPAQGTPRGIYFWPYNGVVYYITDHFYRQGGVVFDEGAVDTTAAYQFCVTLGTSPTLFFKNTAAAYVWNPSTVTLTQVTDVDYPATTVPGCVWLDGTTYVMDTNAYIYGSDLNNQLSWNSLNKIQAQIVPDLGVCLARQLSYVIAFKQWSIEVFYNAGNASGSPLARQTGSKMNFGCSNAYTVLSVGDVLYWVGSLQGGGKQVFQMTNLTVKIISNSSIERLITAASSIDSAFVWVETGHVFYCLQAVINSVNTTLAYDITTDVWSIFYMGDGQALGVWSTPAAFSTAGFTLIQGSGGNTAYGVFGTSYVDETLNGSGTIDSVPVETTVVTPPFEGETRRRKYLKRMDVIADKQSSGVLNISRTDDDYQTWSPYRQVNLSDVRPSLLNCGTFIRRAWKLYHPAPAALRLKAVELQVDEGTL